MHLLSLADFVKDCDCPESAAFVPKHIGLSLDSRSHVLC